MRYIHHRPEWPTFQWDMATLAKCSSDTALRDIRELMEYGILRQGESGGRSTCYGLSYDPDPRSREGEEGDL